MNIQKNIVDALFSELDALDDQAFGTRLSHMMDEQPHIMGFLFNLDDDFSEEDHQFLIKSTIVIRDVFISAGIPLDVIYNDSIEQVVEDRVKAYEEMDQQGEEEHSWNEIAGSPVLFGFILEHAEKRRQKEHNMSLIIDVLIGVFEEAAASANDKKNQTNA